MLDVGMASRTLVHMHDELISYRISARFAIRKTSWCCQIQIRDILSLSKSPF